MLQITDFIVVKEIKTKEGDLIKVLDFDHSIKYNQTVIDKMLEDGVKYYEYREEEKLEEDISKIE